MEKKYLMWIICLISIALFSFPALGAWSITLNTPAASGTVQGTYFLNATTTAGGDFINVTNITFSMLCSDTSNSSYANILTNTSTTNLTSGFGNWISTGTEDSSSCTFRATATNESGATLSDTSTSVTIDNTAPATPTSLTPSSSTTQDGVAFSATVTDAYTTSCILTMVCSGFTTTYSMTNSGSTCTATVDFTGNGACYYTVTATDGLNTSTSSRTDLSIDEQGGGSAAGAIRAKGGQSSFSFEDNKTAYILVTIITVIGYGYWAGWFDSKNNRRNKR